MYTRLTRHQPSRTTRRTLGRLLKEVEPKSRPGAESDPCGRVCACEGYVTKR